VSLNSKRAGFLTSLITKILGTPGEFIDFKGGTVGHLLSTTFQVNFHSAVLEPISPLTVAEKLLLTMQFLHDEPVSLTLKTSPVAVLESPGFGDHSTSTSLTFPPSTAARTLE
jgi:hypothetical protein